MKKHDPIHIFLFMIVRHQLREQMWLQMDQDLWDLMYLEIVAEGYDFESDNVQNLIYEEIVGDS